MALEGKVKTPIGEMNKKTAIVAGVGVAGLGVIVWLRMRKAQQQQNAQDQGTSGGMVTDPAGNQCPAVDPGSGYCPGTPQDQAFYQSQSSQGVNYSGGAGYPYGGPGVALCPDGSTPVGYDANGNPICGQSVTTPPGQITTNSEWLAEAEKTFPSFTTAIAKVLGGVSVSSQERDQFLEAVGVYGEPPQGYPKPIKVTDTKQHPQPNQQVTVPRETGKHEVSAKADLEAHGLRAEVVPKNLPASKPKIVEAQAPAAGKRVARGSVVTLHVKVK